MKNTLCQFTDCDTSPRSMGLCAKHYGVFLRTIGTGKKCKESDCNTPVVSNGYCNRHYIQTINKGTTEITKMDKRQAILNENYAEIPLGLKAKDGYMIVDLSDSHLDKFQWRLHHTGYAYTTVNGKETTATKVIMNTPSDKVVDHINRNKLDNRKSNLRVCTRTENRRYSVKSKRNTTGYKGVVLSYGGKFAARIGYLGKKLHLGTYETPEEAAEAYNRKAKELHGSFALLNEITT